MGKVLVVLAGLIFAACTPSGNFCDVARPIRLSHAVIDQMSDSEAAGALAHNRKGQAMCGWKP